MKAIINYPKGSTPLGEDSRVTKVPEGAAITITTCCKECDWVQKSLSGKPSVCDHHKIKHLRPFADCNKGFSRRIEDPTKRPGWCPL